MSLAAKEPHLDFETLLQRFAAAVGAHDSAGLASLFTPDGCYDDYFFGRHHGREAIAAMLDRFHVGGESFVWQFDDPVCAGSLAYAHYLFSYRSREPDSRERRIVFEGVSRFRLRDGLIAHYDEVFDRGVAFTQLGYATGRIGKLLERYAHALLASPAVKAHLRNREPRPPGAPTR